MSSMYRNFAKVKAIEAKNKQRLLAVNPSLEERSGIYFLTRVDENGINYFYVGQSVNVLKRLAEHLVKYQHIDCSLKTRGFFSDENPFGWKVNAIYYPSDELDKWEQYWILEYTKKGYQCRYNKTSGSQGEGKKKINEFKPSKGYRDGLAQGRKNLARELNNIIGKHLVISLKPEKANNKVSIRAYEKFNALLNVEESEEIENE